MATKIIIIEDNERLSENISELLTLHHYVVLAILKEAENAIKNIEELDPDLVLIDIKLKGKQSGIELAEEIRKKISIPLVFLTSASGKNAIEKVTHVNPDGYIIKPFNIKSVITTIEFAIKNHNSKMEMIEKYRSIEKPISSEIYIRENGWLIKITMDDIEWIKADGSYTHIKVENKVFTLRNTTKEVLANLPENQFVRANKSEIVNLNKIEAINSKLIRMNSKEIPLGRNYYKEIMMMINKISS
tara:strand:- start:151 stop:885 length:735 start_codon:yes stop_codon:yes gene_type:complete